ncbi:MAG: hypothetical protein ACRD3E_16225 [Terriglobales bacterium]
MMALTLKDIVRCPKCGGSDIVYSCEPKCCFNHVCADCRSTFEINTQKTGEFDTGSALEFAEPESGEATTACAACESLNIAVLGDGAEPRIVCGRCRAISKVVIEEFVAGEF